MSGAYAVTLTKAAERDLRKLSKANRQDARRVVAAIRALAVDPRPTGCKKLSGREAWRIRIGGYRVIYEVTDGELTVTVVRLGSRRDVYDR